MLDLEYVWQATQRERGDSSVDDIKVGVRGATQHHSESETHAPRPVRVRRLKTIDEGERLQMDVFEMPHPSFASLTCRYYGQWMPYRGNDQPVTDEFAGLVATYQALLGNVIGYVRAQHGMPQAELAVEVGVGQSTWSRIERGNSSLSFDQLVRAALALDLRPWELLAYVQCVVREAESRGLAVVAGSLEEAGTRLIHDSARLELVQSAMRNVMLGGALTLCGNGIEAVFSTQGTNR